MAATKAAPLKAFVGHFSWSEDGDGTQPDSAKSTLLTCLALCSDIDGAVRHFYELLEQHAKGGSIAPGVEVFLADISEVAIDTAMATLLFSAMTFGPKIHGGVFGTFGPKVEHYEGNNKLADVGADGKPTSFTPQPFAVVAKDGSFFRPA